ncbi:hypothetical protein, partial [Saccharopolyspora shandongensis]|uniref:hypothetical protein n=1 Tax=Saccharopolyspora shandongensis TaxID=418495 RepID=UPI0033FCEFDA
MATQQQANQPSAAAPPVGPPPLPQQYVAAQQRAQRTSKPNPLMRVITGIKAPSKAVRDTVTVANGVLAAGALEHAAEVPWQGSAAIAVVLTATGAAVSRRHGEITFGTTVGASAGGWLIWSAVESPFSMTSMLSLLGSAVIGGVYYAR